jgi:Zn-finger nucleic acid-binding protein
MITLELDAVEVDYCAGCGGIWLDGGELEALLGDSGGSSELIAGFRKARVREKNRRCPICSRRMEKISAGDDPPPLILDRCPKGDGLWFDAGELRDILRRARFDKESRVQRLLAGMFRSGDTKK